jgi:hypothetical protein
MKPYGSNVKDSYGTLPFEKTLKFNIGRRDLKICNCKSCTTYRVLHNRGRTVRKRPSTINASRTLKKRQRQLNKKIINTEFIEQL